MVKVKRNENNILEIDIKEGLDGIAKERKHIENRLKRNKNNAICCVLKTELRTLELCEKATNELVRCIEESGISAEEEIDKAFKYQSEMFVNSVALYENVKITCEQTIKYIKHIDKIGKGMSQLKTMLLDILGPDEFTDKIKV